MALAYHALSRRGTFAASVRVLTGVVISDAALSMRKASYGWELLARLLPRVLRPIADPSADTGAFHGGLRLAAIDGTRFSLRNTPGISAAAVKPKSGKGGTPCAFAPVLCSVLLELGTHCPLALSMGWDGEGEPTPARELFDALPPRALLPPDRLYGSPWLLWELGPALKSWESHFPVRVRDNIKVKGISRLSDGSWLVEVPAHDPDTGDTAGTLNLREIRAQIMVEEEPAPQSVRLWTSLPDPESHPAMELAALYARRWEQELFFRELKSHIHGAAGLLQAQTIDGAAHEVMALMMAAALLAGQRRGVAVHAGVPVLRVSPAQVLDRTESLFTVLEAGKGLLTSEQAAELLRRVLAQPAATALVKPRAPRSCQRAVRQPVNAWPKMRTPTSRKLIVTIAITETNP
ncbi:MAG: transposase family protein [Verrucomicrobiales bacterium]|nr:transposase family protein [Verrucomicrobiales bacterium]